MPTPSPADPVTIDAAIRRVQAWRQAADLPPSRFAQQADLSETTTRGIDLPTWNPTRRTLRKLEALLPIGWQVGDPVPAAGEDPSAAASEGKAA